VQQMENEEIKKDCGMEEIKLPTEICQTNCRICQSEHLKEIHLLRKNGTDFLAIVSLIKKKYNQDISSSSLCRHFQNYNKLAKTVAAEIVQNDLVDEASKRRAFK